MRAEQDHIDDRELLAEADGELSGSRAAAVRAHLEVCPQCRSRRLELEQSMAAYAREHHGLALPQGSGPRALLRARMAGQAATWRTLVPWGRTGWSLAAAALVLAVWMGRPGNERPRMAPDPRLTPGITAPVELAVLCAAPEVEPPPVEAAVARQVFAYYGIRDPAPRSYELDYLITPALGGVADSRNLWPQPYSEGEWNSRVKDALEDRLRALVCAGQMDLATAQHEMARDWIAAYRRHFRTERPLLDHMAFVKDRPWE